MSAWTVPAPRTPGHDAQTATLIAANPQRVATFNDRVIATVARQQTTAQQAPKAGA